MLYHTQLRHVLIELAELQARGGFQCRHKNDVKTYWPALGVFITDEPEAELATLLRGCRICNLPIAAMANTDTKYNREFCTYTVLHYAWLHDALTKHIATLTFFCVCSSELCCV